MREIIQPIINFSLHDPAAVFGLLLIGGAGILYFHIQLKMIKAGYPMRANGWETPTQYLEIRAKYGWSPWPAYLLGLCVLLGIALLVFGLFRL